MGVTAAQRLAWEVESWRSIEFRVHAELAQGDIDQHYIETAAGQRLVDYQYYLPNGERPLQISYCDGQRCAVAFYENGPGSKQTQVQTQRSFGGEGEPGIGGTDRPAPLQMFYVGQEPLQKALPRATHLGTEEHLGRDCDVFLFPRARWSVGAQDVVFCLDRETAIPLEVRSYPDQAARIGGQRPVWVWRALSLDEVQGHHMPLKSEWLDDKGQRERTLTVTELQYDRDYPASTFWPEIQEGAIVFDRIAGTHHVATATEGVPAPSAPITATSVPPLRAEPPSSWSAWLPPAGLGLGIVLLVSGALLGWRRRQV